MSKLFKTWPVDQLMLLPPSVQELVPAGHLAHFVRDTVRDSLDLSADPEDLYGGARLSAVRPDHDDGAVDVCVLPRALRVAADCEGL